MALIFWKYFQDRNSLCWRYAMFLGSSFKTMIHWRKSLVSKTYHKMTCETCLLSNGHPLNGQEPLCFTTVAYTMGYTVLVWTCLGGTGQLWWVEMWAFEKREVEYHARMNLMTSMGLLLLFQQAGLHIPFTSLFVVLAFVRGQATPTQRSMLDRNPV